MGKADNDPIRDKLFEITDYIVIGGELAGMTRDDAKEGMIELARRIKDGLDEAREEGRREGRIKGASDFSQGNAPGGMPMKVLALMAEPPHDTAWRDRLPTMFEREAHDGELWACKIGKYRAVLVEVGQIYKRTFDGPQKWRPLDDDLMPAPWPVEEADD